MAMKELLKIGLAMIREDRLLVVRKRGTKTFILPGGKPEGHERDLEALQRELQEELGCKVDSPRFEGTFTDTAADLVDTIVTVRLYAGTLRGRPCPASEIEEIAWVRLHTPGDLPLAPSITNKILPHLCQQSEPKVPQFKRRAAKLRSAHPVHV